MRKRMAVFLFAVFVGGTLMAGFGWAQSQQDVQKWCPLCGMNLKMFHKTNHRITFKDGHKETYCSLHCAAIALRKYAGKVESVEVVDYVTGKFIPADEAIYLVGSDLPGTMTTKSKIAFARPEDAQKAQKEHGGAFCRFREALSEAYRDMGADKKMLMKKVSKMALKGKKVAEKHGCFKCHGEGGKGIGKAPAWISPGFAKRMDNKVKIKKVILEGKGKMKAFKMPEKELHPLMLYIWSLRAAK